MPHATALHTGTATYPSFRTHLIDNHRIGNESGAVVKLSSKSGCDVTPQIAHMLAHCSARVVEHLLIHTIHSCWNGMCESTTSHDGIKLEGDAFFLQSLHYFTLAQRKLVKTSGVLLQLFGCVANVAEQHWTFVLVYCHFGGSGTWIDD